MSIVGIVAFDDRALAWGDSAVSNRAGRIVRFEAKITFNRRAGVLATGAGRCSLLAQADRLIVEARTLSEILDRLPRLLRDGAARIGARVLYGVGAFDYRCGRVVIHGFRPPRYQGELGATFLAPHVDAPRPTTAAEALELALAQHRLGVVVAGGTLSVGELGPTGIVARPLFNLDEGRFVDADASLPACTPSTAI